MPTTIGVKSIYVDGLLKEKLLKKVVNDLKKKDKDCVLLVDGREGSGKSVFAMGLGYHISMELGNSFGMDNICFKPDEFRERIMKCPDKSVVIYDEAHRGMASARALSEINNILKDMMMEMRQKNLLVIVVLPTFFLLDRYIALFRSRGLFHIYERKGQRGFWVYFNEKRKLKLYMKGKKEFNYNVTGRWPRARGRFYDQYGVDEAEYRKKKKESFMERPRSTKVEHYIKQRNILIYILYDRFKVKSGNMFKLFKEYGLGLTLSPIKEILTDFKRKNRENEPEPAV